MTEQEASTGIKRLSNDARYNLSYNLAKMEIIHRILSQSLYREGEAGITAEECKHIELSQKYLEKAMLSMGQRLGRSEGVPCKYYVEIDKLPLQDRYVVDYSRACTASDVAHTLYYDSTTLPAQVKKHAIRAYDFENKVEDETLGKSEQIISEGSE